MEDAVAGVDKEGAVEAVLIDEVGEVRKVELDGEKAAGAYSEAYAPLPGWNNRSCICAVVSVLSVLERP